MDIIPLGLSCFKLNGKNASVVIDPYDPKIVRLTFPKHTTADIIIVSHDHPDHNFTSSIVAKDMAPIIFHGPGEYEARGIDILGVATFHDNKEGSVRGKNTVYKINIDGINLVHLGDLGHKLNDLQLDEIDKVDVLFIPVGGVFTIDAMIACEIISDLEPKVVIPMHYLRQGLNSEIFGQLAPVSNFLKEIGKEVEPIPRLKVTKDTLPPELQVVVLE